ncbi:probable U3 small nucleolar RNA-associated protein 11 [Primulina eburnea]|uniref:probable U3 small nucleolar RNA-associated protein 11 n=1 Tax=Primulina eburnea TaxID=1245227 RepID=UPI003C6CB2E3
MLTDGIHNISGRLNDLFAHVVAADAKKGEDRGTRGDQAGVRKTDSSYRELEARKKRLKDLEKIYTDMSMQKELHGNHFNASLVQKRGKKRKLREDEMVSPTSRPMYKWRQERKH